MAFSEACSYFSLKDHIEDEEEYAKCENIRHMLLTHWDDKEAYFFKQKQNIKSFSLKLLVTECPCRNLIKVILLEWSSTHLTKRLIPLGTLLKQT